MMCFRALVFVGILNFTIVICLASVIQRGKEISSSETKNDTLIFGQVVSENCSFHLANKKMDHDINSAKQSWLNQY